MEALRPETIIVKNLMEIVVLDKLNELNELEDGIDGCRCEQCMTDIATYVLNRLPPKYASTTKGDIFSKIDALSTQYNASILMLVGEACRVVNENPGHGPDGK